MINQHVLLFGNRFTSSIGILAFIAFSFYGVLMSMFGYLEFRSDILIGRIASTFVPIVLILTFLSSAIFLSDVIKGRIYAVHFGNMFWKVAILGSLVCAFAYWTM